MMKISASYLHTVIACHNKPPIILKNYPLAAIMNVSENNLTGAPHRKTVTELPPELIKSLMKIAENCVIKSNKISRDETPDFVQSCLLKLLLQIEEQRISYDTTAKQYYITKKNGGLIEIERWFGTTAANASIDYYRRTRNQTSINEPESTSQSVEERDIPIAIFAPEPALDMEEQIRQSLIEEMSQYCANALDVCMETTWDFFAKDNYKNFSIDFDDTSPHQDKGVAVADYCQILLEEKYSNDGKKQHSHNSVCKALGVNIRPENIAHKKKKFEEIMMNCVSQKVDQKYNATTKQLLQQ